MLSCPGRFRTSKKLSSVSVARSFPAHLAAKVREPRRPPGLTLSAASSPSWFANQSAGGRFPQTYSMTRREPARPHSELRSSPGSRKAAHTGSKFSAGSISQLQTVIRLADPQTWQILALILWKRGEAFVANGQATGVNQQFLVQTTASGQKHDGQGVAGFC